MGGKCSLVGLVALGCADAPREAFECALPTPQTIEQPNVLLVIIDDVGIDQLAPWDVSPDPVRTPTLDCLCDEGVRFDTVWAAPTCTPGRVAILSGIYPRREDVGRFLNAAHSDWEMPLAWRTIGDAALQAGYATAFVGKWHVGAFDAPSGIRHPNLQGFQQFSGTMGNVRHRTDGGDPGDYWDWEEITNGVAAPRSGYLTESTVGNAQSFLDDMPEPWLMVVSFHGAHAPLHDPPNSLLHAPLRRNASSLEQYRAMVQSVDTELGRLLDSIEPSALARTQIWTLSDNGTPAHGIGAPLDPSHSKDTLHEGGLRVPLVVTGVGVPVAGSSQALVSATDVHASIVETVGAPAGDEDGLSLHPLLADLQRDHRRVLYGDRTRPDGEVDRAVRTQTRKLIRTAEGEVFSFLLGSGLQEIPLENASTGLTSSLETFIEDLDDE